MHVFLNSSLLTVGLLMQPFVESLSKCPKHGLHNPFKSPERFVFLVHILSPWILKWFIQWSFIRHSLHSNGNFGDYVFQVSSIWRHICEGSPHAFPARGNLFLVKERLSSYHVLNLEFLYAFGFSFQLLTLQCFTSCSNFRSQISSLDWYKGLLQRVTSKLLVKFKLLKNF